MNHIESRHERRSGQERDAARRRRRLRPSVTALEARELLANFSVTNLNDTGAGSLRQAISDANTNLGVADTIVFSSLFNTPQTIKLTSGELLLTDTATTTITGPGASRLSVSGNDASRVFEVNSGASASISGLTITGGNAGGYSGGGLKNSGGTVLLSGVAVRGNRAGYHSINLPSSEGGAGLYNNGTMTLVDCTVSGNSWEMRNYFDTADRPNPTYQGGGLFNASGSTLSMTNSTVSGNWATVGGGVYNGGSATLVNCTVSGNHGTGDVFSWYNPTPITMYNSIVAVLDIVSGPPPVGSNNLINNFDHVDAKLGPLGDYGGPTETMMPAPDSPAINAGAASAPGITIPTNDQAGFARTGLPDIGAVEGNYSLVVTTTFSNRGSDPGQVSLAAAVGRANVHGGANTIQFSSPLFDTPQTIFQGGAPILVTDPATTTIDGQGRLKIQGDGGNGIFRVKLGALNLSNLTIDRNSYGLRNFDGTVTLSHVTVTGSSEQGVGNGGIDPTVPFFNEGPPDYLVVPFDPYAFAAHGIVVVQNSFGGTMAMTACTVSGNPNFAVYNNYGYWNGVRSDARLRMTDCMVSGNSGYSPVFNTGELTMTGCTIRGNSGSYEGGGLTNIHGGTAALTDCLIEDNVAMVFGGGVSNSGTLTMTGCTIRGNSASDPSGQGRGGGLSVLFGPATLTNCTITGNTSTTFGGGVAVSSLRSSPNPPKLTMVNCTVSGNSSYHGGGLANTDTATLTNTIVAGNSATAGGDVLNGPYGTISGTNNLIGDGTGQTGLVNGSNGNLVGTSASPINPLLGPLADNGGPTQTMALLPGSPAIDAGTTGAGIPATDQRGTARDANPDIGAFEVAAATHFAVTGFPSPITAGNAGTFTVTALDADGNVATDYTGTVQFTSSDPQATLPSDYTFTSVSGGDNGRHTFVNIVTLRTAGTQSITATDTTTASITGTESGITVTPAEASKLEFGQQPTNATAGEAISPAVTVKVEDTYGNVVTSNSSTVTLTLSNGTTATAVASSGVATFSTLQFDTAGTYIIVSATADSLTGSGESNPFQIFPAAASQLVITQQPSSTATAGVAFATQPVVTAKDRFGNVVTNDSTHTVTAASTGTASLQGTTTVTLVNGVATFSGLSYNKAETIALQFTTNAGSFSATSNNVVVSPAAASKLVLIAPASVPNNSHFDLTVKALDAFNNIATNFSDTVKLASTDTTAVLPDKHTFTAFDQGVYTFTGLILRKKGKQTITAFVTAPPKDSAITGKIDINVT